MTDPTSSPTTPDPTAPATAPAPTVWPTFQATDAQALINFLVGSFGFIATAVYRDGDRIAHAQLDWPEGGGVMLGSFRSDAQWSRPPGTAGMYVVATDVEAVHRRAAAAGAEIVRPLSDTDYGGLEFVASDPEGNLWSFGSYRGEAPVH